MKHPAVFYSDHLMWTRQGLVWAVWRLQPLDFGYPSTSTKLLGRAHHQALLQGLSGESMIISSIATTSPAAVVQRMIEAVDLRENPMWLDTAELTLGALESIHLGERTFWLAVPLKLGALKSEIRAAGRAASIQFREELALPRWQPNEHELRAAFEKAAAVEENLPPAFRPRRATVSEQLWLQRHAQQRGIGAELFEESSDRGSGFEAQEIATGPGISTPQIDEGGLTDLAEAGQNRSGLFKRRFVKVMTPESETASYQVAMALARTPKAGWTFPGNEYLAWVDKMPFDVDFVIRLTVEAASAAKRKNASRETNLADQVFQYSGGNQTITGAVNDLEIIRQDLVEYQKALDVSAREVSVQPTVIFYTSGTTAEDARKRAQVLASELKRYEFHLDTPLGGQEHLWWAGIPGVPAHRIVREYSQLSTGRGFATSLPIVGASLGDPTGFLVGHLRSTGRNTPVLQDPARTVEGNRSGSFGVIGELGSGKTFYLMSVCGYMYARGANLVVIDPTVRREYATFIRALTPDPVVVDVLRPEISLDPLRVFSPDVASRITQTLIATLLGIGLHHEHAPALSRYLSQTFLREHNLGSLDALRRHLATIEGDAAATRIAALLDMIADKDIGRVLFDDSLPAVDLGQRAVVFCTAGLELPDQQDLSNTRMFEQMSIEKTVGYALYAQIASIARELCFADRSRVSLFVTDEVKRLTSSPRGVAVVEEFVLDGRKHNAIIGMAGQDVSHLGNETIRGFLPVRVVMRQPEEQLARAAAQWVGLDAEDPEVIKMIQYDLSPTDHNSKKPIAGREGEGVYRDSMNPPRIGLIKIAAPANEHIRQAMDSRPSQDTKAAV